MITSKINVLMITGVYLPQINGAVRQCSQLINSLKNLINYSILTGTDDKSSKDIDYIDGVFVNRVLMPKQQKIEYIKGIFKFYIQLIIMLRTTDLVHIHGFSKRNALVIAISRLFNKKVIIKMTSYGSDDPISIKNTSYFLWKLFKCCHAYIGISPVFTISYQAAGLSNDRYYFIPNGVDLEIYSPVLPKIKNALKIKYGFSKEDKVIVFIGHFSKEKRPLLLYKAWVKLCDSNLDTKIIFIGHTKNHFEVNEEIIEIIKQDAIKRGRIQFIKFVETTQHVDEYLKIADIFVFTSIREGLPNVLLEAMACALPCIASDLTNITDWLIDDGVTGLLFCSDDPEVLAEKIKHCLIDNLLQQQLGLNARQFITRNLSSASTSHMVHNLYRRTATLNH